MTLIRLVYASQFCESKFDSSELAKIAESSKRNNIKSDITGMLIFGDDRFLQCLEGGREAVSNTYNRIARDPRHESVTLLSVKEIPKREFPEWDMKFALANRVLTKTTSIDSQFNPFEMSPESAYELFKAHIKRTPSD